MQIAIIVIACITAAAVIGLVIGRVAQGLSHIRLIEAETGEKRTLISLAKEWCVAHKPSKRRLIQVYAALLYNANIKGFITGNIYKGEDTKYMCVPGLNCYSCPGAIGACPLGAFQNSLAESKVRAPYYVLGILALFGLTFARTICGFLCPVGLAQELLYKIRTPKLKKSRVTRVLSYFKYVLLVGLAVILPLMYALRSVPLPAFCKYVCPAGTFGGAIGLLINPANASKFSMLGGQFAWKFALLIVFIVGSVFIFRFFCRFFCPLGAIYGFFNKIALLGVRLEKSDCTNCGKCVSVCKMDIKRVGDHECINCGECIPVCPTKAISWKGSRIFLHKSAIDETPEIKAVDVSDGVITLNASETLAPATQEITAAESVPAPVKSKRKGRGAKFRTQIGAVILACAVLIGALVYYNFLYKPPAVNTPTAETGYEIGDIAPDFTVELYRSEESFTLYENRGKLTVINFWATWCTPCVKEMPYFNELAQNHTEINVIAIHGSSTQDVNAYINSNWSGYALTFAQDNMEGANCLTYQSLGGEGLWPLTVILDEDGKVLYNSTDAFHSYEQLETLVNSFNQAE